jgi:hypothetical protein
MTNRLGRPLDRIRALTGEIKQVDGEQKEVLLEEIDILYRRARLLQAAVTFSVLSIFFVATIIFSIFVTVTFEAGLEGLIVVVLREPHRPRRITPTLRMGHPARPQLNQD